MATISEILVEINADPRKFKKALKESGVVLSKESKKMLKDVSKVEKSFFNLGNAVKGVALIALGKRALILADRFNVLQIRIRTATAATGDYNIVSEELFRISQATGTQLQTNVAVFQRLALGARDLGKTNEDVLQLVQVVQQLGVIGGSSTAALQAGLLQLSQGLSAGILRAEEFNSVIENLPEVANAIARGFKVTTGQLRNMVLEGKVLSEDVFEALLKQAPEIAKQFAEIPLSLERAIINFETALGKALSELDTSVGATSALAEAVQVLADNADLLILAGGTLATVMGVNLAIGLGKAAIAAGALNISFLALLKNPIAIGIIGGVTALGLLKVATQETKTELEKFKDQIAEIDKLLKKETTTTKDNTRATLKNKEAFDRFILTLKEENALLKKEIEFGKEAATVQRVVNKAKKAGIAINAQLEAEIAQLVKTNFAFKESLKDTEDAVDSLADKLEDRLENAFDNISDDLADVILGLKDFDDVVQSVFANITAAFLSAGIEQALSGIISGVTGVNISGGGGGGVDIGGTIIQAGVSEAISSLGTSKVTLALGRHLSGLLALRAARMPMGVCPGLIPSL